MGESKEMVEMEMIMRFCVNNTDFDELLRKMNEFNPLKILRVEESELKHSNILAWLLDPKAHHGLGDTILKNIICGVLREIGGGNKDDDKILHINEVLTADFSDTEVFRERYHIDILAVSRSNETVVVIENKYNASESPEQLDSYQEKVEKSYKAYKKLFIFLTLDGMEPKGGNKFLVFTYKQIYVIIKSVIELRKDYLNAKVYDFINQYLEILEEKTMSNKTVIALCQKLYMEHKEAIDRIIEYGKPKIPLEKMREFHDKTNTEFIYGEYLHNKSSLNTYYNFIPKDWKGVVPDTNLYTSDKYLVFYMFNFSKYNEGKVFLNLVIGNFPENEDRPEFVKKVASALRDENMSINSRNSTTNTKILSETIKLSEENLLDYDEVIGKLVKAYIGKFEKAHDVINPIIRKFWHKTKTGAI